jgi:hypothetical protein
MLVAFGPSIADEEGERMEDTFWLIAAIVLLVFGIWIRRRPRRGSNPADGAAVGSSDASSGDSGGGDPGGAAGSV